MRMDGRTDRRTVGRTDATKQQRGFSRLYETRLKCRMENLKYTNYIFHQINVRKKINKSMKWVGGVGYVI